MSLADRASVTLVTKYTDTLPTFKGKAAPTDLWYKGMMFYAAMSGLGDAKDAQVITSQYQAALATAGLTELHDVTFAAVAGSGNQAPVAVAWADTYGGPAPLDVNGFANLNFAALANEGARILEEGYATRASDIDVIYCHGFGFPRHSGGPMFYADTIGLPVVLARVQAYRARFGDYWEPAPLLKRLEAAGDRAEEEGVQIALELIETIKSKQGIHGIHIMAVGWEEIVPRIVTEAGLLPKDFVPPQPKAAAAVKPA